MTMSGFLIFNPSGFNPLFYYFPSLFFRTTESNFEVSPLALTLLSFSFQKTGSLFSVLSLPVRVAYYLSL